MSRDPIDVTNAVAAPTTRSTSGPSRPAFSTRMLALLGVLWITFAAGVAALVMQVTAWS